MAEAPNRLRRGGHEQIGLGFKKFLTVQTAHCILLASFLACATPALPAPRAHPRIPAGGAGGKEVFLSGTIRGADQTRYDIDLTGVKTLELLVENAGSRNHNNWSLWLDRPCSASRLQRRRTKPYHRHWHTLELKTLKR